MVDINVMNNVEFAISGIDFINVLIYLLKLGLALMLLRGRMTLSVLRAFRLIFENRISIKL
jgi:hypothetical protein